MTIKDLILKAISEQIDPTVVFENRELYQLFPLIPKSSIRSALSRMVKNEEIDKIDRGLYSAENIKPQYQKYQHTKRIRDTHSVKPIHEYNLDIEGTITGYAATELSFEQIDKVVNPILVQEILKIISMLGVYLIGETVEFNIMGSEWLFAKSDTFNEIWDVEVKMVNKEGNFYSESSFVSIGEAEFY